MSDRSPWQPPPLLRLTCPSGDVIADHPTACRHYAATREACATSAGKLWSCNGSRNVDAPAWVKPESVRRLQAYTGIGSTQVGGVAMFRFGWSDAMRVGALIGVLGGLMPSQAAAEIYGWVDASGSVTYSNLP